MGYGLDIDEDGRTTFATGRVCPASKSVKGIDVSKWQKTVNWSKVKAAGVAFGIARVSYRTGLIDAYFDKNWAAMKSAGLIRGAYQYFRPSQNARQQADLARFVQVETPGDPLGGPAVQQQVEVTQQDRIFRQGGFLADAEHADLFFIPEVVQPGQVREIHVHQATDLFQPLQ
jgi:hypothetical protein